MAHRREGLLLGHLPGLLGEAHPEHPGSHRPGRDEDDPHPGAREPRDGLAQGAYLGEVEGARLGAEKAAGAHLDHHRRLR